MQVIENEVAKHRIYKEVRRAIIVGHMEPGERLNMLDLAQKYQTSVTPVRDALQMLNQEGLVEIKPRSGYFVTRLTLKELRDLLDLREILELASVERAAGTITEEQLRMLESVHGGYTGDDDESYDRYTDENRRFHCLIAAATGNEKLVETLGHLHDRLARFMVIRHAGLDMVESHRRIVAALRAGDAAGARESMQAELIDTRQNVLDFVIRKEGATWHLDS